MHIGGKNQNVEGNITSGVGAGKATQNYYVVHFRGTKNSAEINLGCAKAILCSLVAMHIALCTGFGQSFAFLANKNAEPPVPPLFWSENCINVGRQIVVLNNS